MDFTDGSRISLVGHLSPGPCLDLELGNAKVADFDPRHIRGASSRQGRPKKSVKNPGKIQNARNCSEKDMELLGNVETDHHSDACDWLVQQHVQRLQVSVDDHGIEGMQITHCSRSISTHFDLLSIDLKGWKHSALTLWTAMAQWRKNPSKQLCFGPKKLKWNEKTSPKLLYIPAFSWCFVF